MKDNSPVSTSIHGIGLDKFFVHFWSPLQLQMYRQCHKELSTPTISFDATGGCCRKIQRDKSGPIFLYEGVMQLKNRSFTALSMLSEEHDNLSILVWLKRWLRCNVKPPKVVISDQSLALMSGLVQAFTQYSSLDRYLSACFSMVIKNEDVEIPLCYIRNDVNHFIHLVTQWGPIKNSIYPSTKQIITRTMGLLVLCTSIKDTEMILEALFDIILSKYDGNIEGTDAWTPCYIAKRYLQSLVTTSVLNSVEPEESYEQDLNNSNRTLTNEDYDADDENVYNASTSFKDWAQSIADKSRSKVESVKGISDNAQYLLALEPIIIRTFKLFPCWSAIMREKFGFGEETASSSRIESNFNHIKNRVFKNSNLPLRVDSFVEQLIAYYRGDHLLLQGGNDDHLITRSDEGSQDKNDNITFEDENNFSISHKHNNDDLISILNDDLSSGSHYIFVDKNNINSFQMHSDDDLMTRDNERLCNGSGLKCDEQNNISNSSTDDSSLCSYSAIDEIDEQPSFSSSVSDSSSNISQCQACRVGNLPTGLHKCAQCDKSVHILFGCSIRIPGTTEGCGEPRICLDCDEKNSKIAENNATEKWNRKRKLQNSRSSRSYLVRQPGFEFLDLNKKGSIIPVILLKNGNHLLSRPISVPEQGKLMISNTCSVDSILSILATSAADSSSYRKYLYNLKETNLTASIALQMITEKKVKQIYYNRALLLLQF